MAKKTYKATVSFIFHGKVEIKAKNPEQALEYLQKHFGCVLGNVHTTLPEADIDWNFNVHPEKTILLDV